MDRRGNSPQDKPLYMISVAAELTGMHPQTLRVYEQKGLVNPGRSRGNTRLYSARDIERLNLISKLTDEGINLAGVVRSLDMRERITALARYDATNPENIMRSLLNASSADEAPEDGLSTREGFASRDGFDGTDEEAPASFSDSED